MRFREYAENRPAIAATVSFVWWTFQSMKNRKNLYNLFNCALLSELDQFLTMMNCLVLPHFSQQGLLHILHMSSQQMNSALLRRECPVIQDLKPVAHNVINQALIPVGKVLLSSLHIKLRFLSNLSRH